MTVTKRRVKAEPSGPEGTAAQEPGIKYTCDCCSIDITHTVRIKCAKKECEEVDLCPNCFSEGKEVGPHKAWHDYRVVETHSSPIFVEDWGADEELLLISGLQTSGMGNWLDVAEFVGTRTKEECEKHYNETYLLDRSKPRQVPSPSSSSPMPNNHNHSTNGQSDGHGSNGEDTATHPRIEDWFMDENGEKEHEGLCTPAEVINKLGGVGGFGKVALSGKRGEKRRIGWREGLKHDDGWSCPMPRIKPNFSITAEEFQSRKKRRLEEMRKPHPINAAAIETKASAPNCHEVQGFMPGRLEFEHEVENEAEMVIKDMDFGLVSAWGGFDMREGPPPGGGRDGPPETEGETRNGRSQKQSTKTIGSSAAGGKSAGKTVGGKKPAENGDKKKDSNGDETDVIDVDDDEDEGRPLAQLVDAVNHETDADNDDGKDKDEADEHALPANIELEDPEDMELKLTALEIYYERLGTRQDVKDFLFDRGLMDHKRLAALDRKRSKDDNALVQRYKIFAKLQTAQDFEILVDGLLYEQALKRKIVELQKYRQSGITNVADAARFDKLEADRAGGTRSQQQTLPPKEYFTSSDAILHRVVYRGPGVPTDEACGKPPYPSNPTHFTQADDLHLLSESEQRLCCDLQLLPRPYLLIKGALVRECARRGGDISPYDMKKMFSENLPDEVVPAIYNHLKSTGEVIVV